MLLPSELTDAQRAALVEAMRIFAARGRALRLERAQQEKAKTAETMGIGATVLTGMHGAPLLPKDTADA